MKARIEEALGRILSRKHDAIIKVKFKEREDEQGSNNNGAGRVGSDARKRD